jgi:two-component system, cell cycle response regulator
MEAGVDDFPAKPFNELELKARLLVGKRLVVVQQELIAAREAMRSAATYDGLTGLLNRREIVQFVERELSRAAREKHPVSVILADLDYCKRINDQHGHLVGDEVLKEVPQRLTSGVRSYDRVGRYGGEEFLIVLPGCDLVSAFTRADQLRDLISSKPINAGSVSTSVTLSMGLAVADSSVKRTRWCIRQISGCTRRNKPGAIEWNKSTKSRKANTRAPSRRSGCAPARERL